MTERTPTPPAPPTPAGTASDTDVREAKGAAREAIGKLLGDDQAVRDGRSEQRDAGDDADERRGRSRATTTSKTEQE